MSVLIVFLYALVVVVSLLLIGLILIQPSKSGGMGAAFGGIGESMFGGKAGSHLTKATVWLTAIFMVLALIGHGARMESGNAGVEKELAAAAKAEKKAAPAAKPAAKAEKKAAPAAKPAAKAEKKAAPAAKPAVKAEKKAAPAAKK